MQPRSNDSGAWLFVDTPSSACSHAVTIITSSSRPAPYSSDMAQFESLPSAFRDAFDFFAGKMRRTGTTGGVGLYYDRYSLQLPTASDPGPISIGSTGFGMISVCIGCALGLYPKSDGVRMTLETLESLLGERQGFAPKRSNRTRFFAHFLDPESGNAASSTTEISTVDTAIMAAGAMFARNYLKDPTVTQKTNSLVQSIDWGAVVGEDPYLCMVMDADTGNPDWTKKTKPFNEYYVLACVGKAVEEEMNKTGSAAPCTTYFNKYYSNPPQSLKDAGASYKSYWGYNVWSDSPNRFASSFQVQFCYYLSKFFQTCPAYQEFFAQSAAADWKYFRNIFANPAYKNIVTKYAPYQWGCGAGEYPGGYFATAIDNDDKLVYSAPIIAGFFPADNAVSKLQPQSFVHIEDALEQLYSNEVCTSDVDGKKVLWRRSLVDKEWLPGAIQSVDFSTFILGYAWKLAGAEFFSANAI